MMAAARLVILAAAVLASVITAGMGRWQLDRAAEKQRLQDSRDALARLPPVDDPGAALAAATDMGPWGRRLRLTGVWMADATVYLDNRAMAGRVGFHVVTPLVLLDGRVVAVQRGWLPRHVADRTRMAEFQTPAGQVQVSGRIAPTVSRMYQLGEAASGAIRQNLDLGDYSIEIRRRLMPLVVVQEDDPRAPSSDGLLRHWPEPASDVHKHHGYAFQWFGLSALIVVLYVWFQLVRPRCRQPH